MNHKWLWRLGAIVAPVALAACKLGTDDAASSSDEVTSVENTGVKSQAIANCWLYATAGWVESLHKGATTRDLDVSEAYWNYWFFYEEITGTEFGGEYAGGSIEEGGWWGFAAELIHRYGWMHEGDFIPEADANAKRHADAVVAINASLTTGALSTPAGRRDPRIVRAELDKAWKLSPTVIEDLQRQFPIVVGVPPVEGALPPPPAPLVALTERAASGSLGLTRIHAPQELAVVAADGASNVTLADTIGRRAPGATLESGLRVGEHAWSEVAYDWTADPADSARRRAMLKNMQAMLNRRLAIPVAWAVSSDVRDGVYVGGPYVSEYNVNGLHESVLVDYEVDDVPGYGTLRVDVRETRPEALEATLADTANVRFFRIKNSWGVDPLWTTEEMRQAGIGVPEGGAPAPTTKPSYLASKPGFNDLTVAYLDTPITFKPAGHFMLAVAMPPKLPFTVPPRAAIADAGPGEGGASDGGAGRKQ